MASRQNVREAPYVYDTSATPSVDPLKFYPIDNEEIAVKDVLLTVGGGSKTTADIKQELGPQKCSVYFGSSAPEVLLQKFPEILRLDVKNFSETTVTARATLELCQNYTSGRGCHNSYPGFHCNRLHICKFFLSDACTFGGKCRFAHQLLQNHHNFALIHSSKLSHLDEGTLKILIRRHQESDTTGKYPASSRTKYPDSCSYYNAAKGCNKGNRGGCSFLHVCKYYLIGDCSFGDKCKRSHSLWDPQPRKLLKKSGIDVANNPEATRRTIQLLRDQLSSKS